VCVAIRVAKKRGIFLSRRSKEDPVFIVGYLSYRYSACQDTVHPLRLLIEKTLWFDSRNSFKTYWHLLWRNTLRIVTLVCVWTRVKPVNSWGLNSIQQSPLFRRVRKITKSDCLLRLVSPFVRPPVWNNPALSGRISMKFDIWAFFFKTVGKVQVPFKSGKNNEYFTCKRFHIYDNISLNSS
jgi:hypothetical protein